MSVTYRLPAPSSAIARAPEAGWTASSLAVGGNERAPFVEEGALAVESHHAVVPRVGHIDRAIRRHGDAPRLPHLAVAKLQRTVAVRIDTASLVFGVQVTGRTPLAHEGAIRSKDLDAMIA